MKKVSQIWFNIQGILFPFIEKEIEEPLTEKLKQLVATLELIRIEDFVHIPDYLLGQSPKNRKQIARSFVAKVVYNMATTRELIDRLKTTPALRRICGWEKASQIPHESSFSRAFAEFAQNGIAQIVHESLVKQHLRDHLVGHISRDSTAIDGREKPQKKNKVAYVSCTQKPKRKRDPRFAERDRYKERFRQERAKKEGRLNLFTVKDFTFAEDKSYCICPAGKRLYRNGGNVLAGNYRAIKFRGPKTVCRACEVRAQCLRHPDRTEARQVHFFVGRSKEGQETYTQKMKQKIDSDRGRMIYSKRIGTVEPVFANLRNAIGLDRFTLRGKLKVNIQWKLFCIVHNLLKIHRVGNAFT